MRQTKDVRISIYVNGSHFFLAHKAERKNFFKISACLCEFQYFQLKYELSMKTQRRLGKWEMWEMWGS